MPQYSVKVRRTSYGWTNIEVAADNEAEAMSKAEEIAGDYSFSEKESEYEAEWAEQKA